MGKRQKGQCFILVNNDPEHLGSQGVHSCVHNCKSLHKLAPDEPDQPLGWVLDARGLRGAPSVLANLI